MENIHHMESLLIRMRSENYMERNNAEIAYYKKKETQPNELVLSLLSFISQSNDADLKAYAIVILRQTLVVNESGVNFMSTISNDTSAALKSSVLNLISSVGDLYLMTQLSDVVSQIAVVYFNAGDIWEEMIQWCFHLGVNGTDQEKIVVFRIFEELSAFFAEIPFVVQNINSIVDLFATGLQSPDTAMCIAALKAFQFVIEAFRESRSNLRGLVPNMTNAIARSIEQGDEEGAEACVQVFINICGSDPSFFKYDLDNIISVMLNIANSDSVSSPLNQISSEFLVSLCENKSKLVKQNAQFIDSYIQTLLKLMLTVPNTTLEEWDVVTKKKDKTNIFNYLVAEGHLDRISIALNGDTILPIIWVYIQQFISDEDWRKRYTSLKALSIISEGCRDVLMTAIDDVVNMVTTSLTDQDPRVRWCAIHAIGILATDFAPSFQNTYYDHFIPKLVSFILNTQYNKVREHSLLCLINILDSLDRPFVRVYLEELLGAIFHVLQNTKVSLLLQSAVVVLTSTVGSSNADFIPYYDNVMNTLKQLYSAYDDHELQAKILECISVIAISVGKDIFQKDVFEVTNLLKTIQDTVEDPSDPLVDASFHAWVRISKCLKEDFAPYLDYIMQPLMEILQGEDPDIDPTQMDDDEYVDFLSGFEEKIETVNLAFSFGIELKETLYPYIEPLSQIAVEILQNEHVLKLRIAGYALIPVLLDSARKHQEIYGTDKKFLHDLFIFTFPYSYGAVSKEEDLEALQLGIESLYLSLDYVGPDVLVESQIVELLNTIRSLMTEIRERRQYHLNANQDDDEDTILFIQEQLYLDATIIHLLAEIITPLLKHYKNETMQAFDKVGMMDFLSELLNSDEPEEVTLAVLIFDDLVEVGNEVSHPLIPMLLPTIIQKLGVIETPGFRQAALYGFGECAKNGGTVVEPFLQQLVNTLVELINSPESSNATYAISRDNAISSVAKMIEFRHNFFGDSVAELIKLWLGWLPLSIDKDEAKIVHAKLCSFIENYPPIFGNNYSNLPQILRIFSQIYTSQLVVTPETNAKINQILTSMQTQIPDILQEAYNTLSDKEKQRLGNF